MTTRANDGDVLPQPSHMARSVNPYIPTRLHHGNDSADGLYER